MWALVAARNDSGLGGAMLRLVRPSRSDCCFTIGFGRERRLAGGVNDGGAAATTLSGKNGGGAASGVPFLGVDDADML